MSAAELLRLEREAHDARVSEHFSLTSHYHGNGEGRCVSCGKLPSEHYDERCPKV